MRPSCRGFIPTFMYNHIIVRDNNNDSFLEREDCVFERRRLNDFKVVQRSSKECDGKNEYIKK